MAKVKAIRRACIRQVEYDPETNRARADFLRLPTRALISRLAPEGARIGVVAGAGFDTDSLDSWEWEELQMAKAQL